MASRLLGDSRDAEEITQDALMTVVRKIGTFRGEAAFSSWLYRIAANAAYERLRSRRTRAEVPLDPLLTAFGHAAYGALLGVIAGTVEDTSVSTRLRTAA